MSVPDSSRLEQSGRLVIWEALAEECRIVCTAALLEAIRQECVLAARGPVPLGVGGALLGEYSSGTYRIRSWRPIPCRHQRGPSFLLTKDEVAGLKGFLSHLPALTGKAEDVIIGWFVSHPHAGAVLRDDEISLHQRFFRASDLFLLIEIRPGGGLEVAVHRGARPVAPSWRILPSPSARKVSASPDDAGAVADAPPAETPGRRGKRRSLTLAQTGLLIPGIVLLAAALALSAWLYSGRQAPPPTAPPPLRPLPTLSLRLERQQTGFLVRWNPVDSAFSGASQVVLGITDGASVTERQLSPAEIQAGSLLHASSSAVLEVEMRVESAGGRTVRERVLFGK